ncbi:unnamed protein product, partial [Brassica rapa subsp. narinosa]
VSPCSFGAPAPHQSLRRCGRCRESKTTACSSRVLVLHRLLFLLSDWTNSLILLNLLVC